jgi:hypothetical protein
VQALRRGFVISELRKTDGEGTDATRGRVEGVLRDVKASAEAIIDVIGLGAGVVDEMRPRGFKVKAFNAAAKTEALDSSGELGFVNCRSAAWWNLRELLDPDSGIEVALPPDDDLTSDLTSPKWRVMSGGRIQVESKEDVKKRLGRSTDSGDAVIQAFWEGEEEPAPPSTGKSPWG